MNGNANPAPRSNEEQMQLEQDQPDLFEHFLDAQQLPYYRAARRTSLSYTRLEKRIEFLTTCKEEGLTPRDLLFKPRPPQGLALNPSEVTAWKTLILTAQASAVATTLTACNRELPARRNLRDQATSDLTAHLDATLNARTTEELRKKVNTTAEQMTAKHATRLTECRNRLRMFNNTTNPSLLNRPAPTRESRPSAAAAALAQAAPAPRRAPPANRRPRQADGQDALTAILRALAQPGQPRGRPRPRGRGRGRGRN